MAKQYRTQTHKRRGFTLVELGVAMAVIGLLVVGALGMTRPIVETIDIKATKANMATIAEALSAYARVNNRLPCPADPDISKISHLIWDGAPVHAGFYMTGRAASYTLHELMDAQRSQGLRPDIILAGTPKKGKTGFQAFGAEIGSEDSALGYGDCDGVANAEGIVPYLTLGLKPDVVKDAWGRYFSYRVSPAFAANPEDLAATPVGNAPRDHRHERCRTPVWYDQDGAHKNPAKAAFCCPVAAPGYDASTDIEVRHAAGGSRLHQTRPLSGPEYDVYTTKQSNTDALTNITVPAFILVSHGPNGYGAFRDDGTRITDVAFGDDEERNADGDEEYIQHDWDETPGSTYYDDIAFWMTQDQVYALLGDGQSCAYP